MDLEKILSQKKNGSEFFLGPIFLDFCYLVPARGLPHYSQMTPKVLTQNFFASEFFLDHIF